MPSSESLKKRKQSPSSGESRTLLSFFNTKRPKRSPSVVTASTALPVIKTVEEHTEIIVISDDEDFTQENPFPDPVDDILDLSFSGDEWDSKNDEPVLIEDEGDLTIEDSRADSSAACEVSRCLGNQLLSDTINLGACSICGLLLLDATEKEISEHVAQCLSKPDAGPIRGRNQLELDIPPSRFEVEGRGEPSGPINTAASKVPNALNKLMSSREEKEAWDAVDATKNAKRDVKARKPEGKGKGKGKAAAGAKDGTKQRRPAPFYKVMPGMPIAVDAFCYGKIPGVTAYFLSHAHSDHYTNLSSSWKNGPIYCSETTGNLIKHMLRVDPKWVHSLPENEAVEIPDTGGVKVTLIDANHCPGSSLFVFSGKQTVDAGDSHIKSSFVGTNRQFTYLHCGDFRACPAHALHPAIHGQQLDTVYLDTTYLNPKYCFPPQELVINACAELAKQYVQGANNKTLLALPSSPVAKTGWFTPSAKTVARLQSQTSASVASGGKLKQGITTNTKILVVVGTYTIGKERVLKAIAKVLSSKIYCNSRKHAVFMCQADPELHAMLTKNPTEAQVHVLPLGQISIESLGEYLELHKAQYGRILGFRPTGWTYTPPAGQSTTPTIDQILAQARAHKYTAADLSPQRGSNARITIYGVPYSEHSSFRELTCFALSIDWGRMIATVNVGSADSRQKMQVWFEKWAKARRERAGAMVEHRCEEYW